MITVLAEDYVRMARAKGLKRWRIMWAYAGRNAILPNLTGFAMALGFVVSGAILVEYVFNYPGLGNLLLRAVEGLDYPAHAGPLPSHHHSPCCSACSAATCSQRSSTHGRESPTSGPPCRSKAPQSTLCRPM